MVGLQGDMAADARNHMKGEEKEEGKRGEEKTEGKGRETEMA